MLCGTGPELDWECQNCPKAREKDLHPYTNKLMANRLLKIGGYRHRRNDLTPDEWMDLGRLELCLETKQP